MPCPTCDHTMECVGAGVFMCPRCGSVKNQLTGETYRPELVDRCRAFGGGLNPQSNAEALTILWSRLGIAESINLPNERK